IRDRNVTGVQTCALPISAIFLHRKQGNEPGDGVVAPRFVTGSLQADYLKPTPANEVSKAVGVVEEIHPKKYKVKTELYAGDSLRSEERRVGKEWKVQRVV